MCDGDLAAEYDAIVQNLDEEQLLNSEDMVDDATNLKEVVVLKEAKKVSTELVPSSILTQNPCSDEGFKRQVLSPDFEHRKVSASDYVVIDKDFFDTYQTLEADAAEGLTPLDEIKYRKPTMVEYVIYKDFMDVERGFVEEYISEKVEGVDEIRWEKPKPVKQ